MEITVKVSGREYRIYRGKSGSFHIDDLRLDEQATFATWEAAIGNCILRAANALETDIVKTEQKLVEERHAIERLRSCIRPA